MTQNKTKTVKHHISSNRTLRISQGDVPLISLNGYAVTSKDTIRLREKAEKQLAEAKSYLQINIK